jgi:hypothetical protein
MKSYLSKILLCTSISLSFIMAGEVQDKLSQMAKDLNTYALMAEASPSELEVLQQDIKVFFAKKYLGLQQTTNATAANSTTQATT